METNGDTADIYIFGNIVPPDITAKNSYFGVETGEVSGLSILQEINELNTDVINVHINSMGGHTSEGLAIYNSLKNNKAKIITYVDGFACSAASVAFMAGDERIMNEASILIVHNTLFDEVSGNGAQLRQRADELDKISQVVENAYAPKVNIDKDELAKLLDGKNHEGTILNPEEALKIGLATSIYTMEKTTMPVQSMQKKIFERIMANPQSCNNIKVDENRIIDGIVERLGKQFISKVPDTHKPVEENKQQKFLNALANRKD